MRVRACALAELAPGKMRRVEGDDHEPVVVANVDGEVFCIDDTCTHEKFPLSEGWLDGDVIECALHLAQFCVRDGKALCLPATSNVNAHQVEVVDGDVWVVIQSS